MHAQWSGRWTLITGASAGIGQAFANELAAGNSNLVLTARRIDRLEGLASDLRSKHGVSVKCVAADLEQPNAPIDIFNFTQANNLPIDFLINNAGFGAYGEFRSSDLARQVGMVNVNCGAVVHLTHLYLPGMIERRRGDILIVASTAAFQGVPYMAVYAASKGFDLLLAEALAQEVKRYGVRVCALCPGATESEFDRVAGSPLDRIGRRVETSQKVVRVGLEALVAGKHSVVSGMQNKLSSEFQRLIPRRGVTAIAEKIFRPKNI